MFYYMNNTFRDTIFEVFLSGPIKSNYNDCKHYVKNLFTENKDYKY